MKKILTFTFALLQMTSLKAFSYALAYESSTFNFRFSSIVSGDMIYSYDDILADGILSFSAPATQVKQFSSYSGDALATTSTYDDFSGPSIYSSVYATSMAGNEAGLSDAYIEKTIKLKIKNTSNFIFDEINFSGHYSTLWPTTPLVAYEGDIPLDVYKWAAMVDDHNFGGAAYEGFLQYPTDAGYGTGCDTDHPDLSEPYARNYDVTPTYITCAIRGEPPVHDGGFSLRNLAPGEELTLTFFQSARTTAYSVPEPSPFALLVWSFAGIAAFRYRRRK